ncbi:MAG: tetratricopeptide repeat protein, partial [Sandaracinaceae bacterium]
AGSFAGLGAARIAARQPRQAIAAYPRAVALQPRNAAFHAALGQAYQQAGDGGRARAAYQRALAIDPSNAGARRGLSSL